MSNIPYCPLLSLNQENPVMCQEELCMWYVKQLKLCAITVQAYASAINTQPESAQQSVKPKQTVVKKPQAAQTVKQPLTNEPKKEELPKQNPFALDDLD